MSSSTPGAASVSAVPFSDAPRFFIAAITLLQDNPLKGADRSRSPHRFVAGQPMLKSRWLTAADQPDATVITCILAGYLSTVQAVPTENPIRQFCAMRLAGEDGSKGRWC